MTTPEEFVKDLEAFDPNVDYDQPENHIPQIYLPEGGNLLEILGKITHLGIGAHQDDLEIMAFPGIYEGYANDDSFFAGITVTNGSGCPRTGEFKPLTDDEMVEVRRAEQNEAADVGKYSMQVQLMFPSSAAKNKAGSAHESVTLDLATLISMMPNLKTIYTHQPADKHASHVGVADHVVRALQDERIPKEKRDSLEVYGCEVWRKLDWMVDTIENPDPEAREKIPTTPNPAKITLPTDQNPKFRQAVLKPFRSQNESSKYDEGTIGGEACNATFGESHENNSHEATTHVMDLGPAVRQEKTLAALSSEHIMALHADVLRIIAANSLAPKIEEPEPEEPKIGRVDTRDGL